MIAYKLLRVRRDGTLGSLFINRAARLPVETWLYAQNHPTKGYKVRPGWHCLSRPSAPQVVPRANRRFQTTTAADYAGRHVVPGAADVHLGAGMKTKAEILEEFKFRIGPSVRRLHDTLLEIITPHAPKITDKELDEQLLDMYEHPEKFD